MKILNNSEYFLIHGIPSYTAQRRILCNCGWLGSDDCVASEAIVNCVAFPANKRTREFQTRRKRHKVGKMIDRMTGTVGINPGFVSSTRILKTDAWPGTSVTRVIDVR